jgi:histidinol-phosphate phosphatase family protein
MKEHNTFLLSKKELADYTLFIDRDGVINEPIIDYYACKPADLVLCEGSVQALSELSVIFKHIILVTNQQGVGKGVMSETDLENVHLKLYDATKKDASFYFDASFYAPYLKSEAHLWRKPQNGMLLKAKTYFPDVDWKKSIMIGDSPGDMQLADSLGLLKVRIRNTQFSFENQDYSFDSLAGFVASLQYS